MTEHETFERRLARALDAYALEAPTELDALELAHAIAAGHPRTGRRVWGGRFRRATRPARWFLVGLALLLLAFAAFATAGGLRVHRGDLTVDQRSSPLPSDRPVASTVRGVGELYGEWQAVVPAVDLAVSAGTYTLDLNGAAIVRAPDGAPLDRLGRATAVTATGEGAFEVIVRAPGPCGEGRYALHEDRGPGGAAEPGPSAAPLADETSAPGSWEYFRLTREDDPCTDREAILSAGPWERTPDRGPRLGPFTPGETYTSGVFTEPFSFVMPAVDDTGENGRLPDQFRFASRYVSDGGLSFRGPWWSMVILDDVPVSADLCDRNGPILPGIPSTPQAVVDWYRASGLPITEPVGVPVDGRIALRFDLLESDVPCNGGRLPLGGFYPYAARAYAIPTGDDTILVVFGSDGVNWEAVKTAVGSLVRSIHFD